VRLFSANSFIFSFKSIETKRGLAVPSKQILKE